MNKKVILGLSGGVDSTVAALFLQEKGYDVTGLYFDVSGCEADGVCLNEDSGRGRAEKAARQLGIRLIYKDVSREFEQIVIDNFCSEYMNGRTPNPCIVCNPNVKFKVLMEAASEEGADHIATGHYAGTYYDENSGLWYVKTAVNERKDQSYMLYRLEQDVISRLLLPLDEIKDKQTVRELARSSSLGNAEADDSQEICFIDKDDNYKAFLRRRGFSKPEGDFVDKHGNVLGRHGGILNYTIGQRKGLGIALGKPAFVTKLDGENNTVVLGDNDDLFGTQVISADNVLVLSETDKAAISGEGLEIKAKIRYAARPSEAVIRMSNDGFIVTDFKEMQRAATPGQSIVFYRDGLVIGGGFIV